MASFTERYHQLTKYNPHTIDKLGAVHWDSQPPAFKTIHSLEKLELLPSIQSAIEALRAGEADGVAPVIPTGPGLSNIAQLLFFTLGLTARLEVQGGEDFFLRAAPSAGGLYPTEMYVAVRNQTGIADGLYHYHSLKSALIPVWQGAFWADLKHYFLGHPAVDASNLIVLFTGTYGRSAWRYKERAYRRILLDTGHAVGNLLEVCRTERQDYAVMGGFLDQGLEELLFLTAKEEFPLLGVAIGPEGTLPRMPEQTPGDVPTEAIKRVVSTDPMQVQQNACERILDPKLLRAPIALPCSGPAFDASEQMIFRTILGRRSCRKFNGQAIPLEKAMEILAYAFREEGAPWCMAAGKLDFHFLALNVDGLESGVYAVDGLDRGEIALKLRKAGDFRSETQYMCLGQDLGADSAFVLVHTADLPRLSEMYGDRGYRYACLDAGQIGERINLWAVHQGLGSSGIGGYYDDLANELLDLPLSHGILYITLVGMPETT